MPTPGYEFVSEVPADEYRAEYIQALSEGVLAGLADPYETVAIGVDTSGFHFALFPTGDDFFGSPRPQEDTLAMQQGLALQVVLRELYDHEVDSNELAFRRAGRLAVRAAVDEESDLRYWY